MASYVFGVVMVCVCILYVWLYAWVCILYVRTYIWGKLQDERLHNYIPLLTSDWLLTLNH